MPNRARSAWEAVRREFHRARSAFLLLFLGLLTRGQVLGLRRAARRYRDLFEQADDIVYEYDLVGRCLAVNPAAARLLGYSLAELRALPLEAVVAPAYHARVRRGLRVLARRGRDGVVAPAWTVELVARDGRCLPIEVSARIVREGGLPVLVQGIARDIAARQRTELALRDSEARLRLYYEHCPLPTLT